MSHWIVCSRKTSDLFHLYIDLIISISVYNMVSGGPLLSLLPSLLVLMSSYYFNLRIITNEVLFIAPQVYSFTFLQDRKTSLFLSGTILIVAQKQISRYAKVYDDQFLAPWHGNGDLVFVCLTLLWQTSWHQVFHCMIFT